AINRSGRQPRHTVRPLARPFTHPPETRTSKIPESIYMYIHLFPHEPTSQSSLHVQQHSPRVPSANADVRAGASTPGLALVAVHHPASAVASRRNLAGATRRDIGHGQHHAYPHSGN